MQSHQKEIWVFLLLVCAPLSATSQGSLLTDVILVGTKHTPHTGYHSDSLLKVVVNLKPDVVLIEHDSVSGIFKTGQFKPIPRWIKYLSRITGRSKNDIEGNMIHKLYREFPQVIVKPIDVALNGPERDKYRKEFIRLENVFEVGMSSAFDNKEMSPYRANLHLKREQLRTQMSKRMYSTLQEFNTDSTTEIIRQLQTLEESHIKSLVDSVPSLQPFSKRVYQMLENWQLRDKVMAQQIQRYISAYPSKRIVVISGFFHRYYQIDHLVPKREEMNFRLLDIDGKEMTLDEIISFSR
ncbi:MAG: ChaN family lipoprotein [Chitinophagaceae bacterium]